MSIYSEAKEASNNKNLNTSALYMLELPKEYVSSASQKLQPEVPCSISKSFFPDDLIVSE